VAALPGRGEVVCPRSLPRSAAKQLSSALKRGGDRWRRLGDFSARSMLGHRMGAGLGRASKRGLRQTLNPEGGTAMEQIAEWLAKLGMSEYAERFAENRIDFAVLPDLTDQDLKDIGVVLGDRRKILRAIARLDPAPEAVVLELKPPVISFAAVQGLPVESRERRDVTQDEIVRDTGGGPPRANYHRLIARAVKGLERSSVEARQVIYERAREALIAHLRFNQPGLPKAAIVKERLALEDAIRKIEAEAAGKSRTPTEPQPAIPSVGIPGGGAASEPPRRDDANPADMPEGAGLPCSSMRASNCGPDGPRWKNKR
jgi:hypothetical protein